MTSNKNIFYSFYQIVMTTKKTFEDCSKGIFLYCPNKRILVKGVCYFYELCYDIWCYYITKRSVWWYYGFNIAAASATFAASASARRPWWSEHSNSKNIQPISFKFYTWVDTPWGTLLLKFDTLRALEQLRSQPNDTCIPQIFNMQYLRK